MMLRLMSYNIRFGGVGREQLIADVIRHCGPDIVLLQEATRERSVEEIPQAAGMPYWAGKQGYSTAFLSRVEARRFEWRHPIDLQRAFQEIEFDVMRIFNVHLRVTHSNYTERGRMREVRAVLRA